jgi:hypothetical protein
LPSSSPCGTSIYASDEQVAQRVAKPISKKWRISEITVRDLRSDVSG